MAVSEFIFQFLAYIGMVLGFACGWYVLKSASHYSGDRLAKINLRFLGIADLCAATIFLLSVLHIDGFAIMSSFAMFMRPVILMFILLPALIAFRMGEPKQ